MGSREPVGVGVLVAVCREGAVVDLGVGVGAVRIEGGGEVPWSCGLSWVCRPLVVARVVVWRRLSGIWAWRAVVRGLVHVMQRGLFLRFSCAQMVDSSWCFLWGFAGATVGLGYCGGLLACHGGRFEHACVAWQGWCGWILCGARVAGAVPAWE